jgi:predicted phage terminase large subunit-like protein
VPTLGEIAGQVRRLSRRAERRKAAPAAPHAVRPFGTEWEREYMPHHLTSEASRFHAELMADLESLHTRRGQMLNYRGPRGSGKTSHISNAYPLWAALEGVEPFTLLLAETGEQAKTYLKTIRAEVEGNERIRADYPTVAGTGPVWRDDRVVLRNGCCIAARGSAGRVLGLKHGAHRPTLVIGDDLNQRADAYSPTLRRRKTDWFLKDVLAVGTPQTNFIVAGTSIHREAITCELTTSGVWRTRRYQSVLRWPERMDLWAEWERRLTNLGDDGREQAAAAFYAAHRTQMDNGGEVLWPSRYPLVELMRIRAQDQRAFQSERQDEPGTDGSTEWPPDYFDRPDLWFDEWPDDLAGRAYYLDPSKGEGSKAGDWQAHVWGGWSKGRNALCVECDCRREPTTDMVGRAITNAMAFGCPVTAETNSTMGLLMAEFERQASGKAVGLQGINNTDAKLQRIRTLGPFLARGQVKVRNTAGGRELVSQLRDVPNGEYDDCPDAASGMLRRVLVNLNGGG